MKVEIRKEILEGFEEPYKSMNILNIERINIKRNSFIAEEDEEKWEYDLSCIKKVLWISLSKSIIITDEYDVEIEVELDLDMDNNIVFEDSKGYRCVIDIKQD